MTVGAPTSVKVTRMMAVDITNIPDDNNTDTPNFRRADTRRCIRIGSGMDISAASLMTLKIERIIKFCGL